MWRPLSSSRGRPPTQLHHAPHARAAVVPAASRPLHASDHAHLAARNPRTPMYREPPFPQDALLHRTPARLHTADVLVSGERMVALATQAEEVATEMWERHDTTETRIHEARAGQERNGLCVSSERGDIRVDCVDGGACVPSGDCGGVGDPSGCNHGTGSPVAVVEAHGRGFVSASRRVTFAALQ